MNIRFYRVVLLCLLGSTVLSGCKESKTSPISVIPANGTSLYVAECNPFEIGVHDRKTVTLVPDPTDACTTPIQFYTGYSATWTSNVFRPDAAEVTEGVHLVFNRNLQEAADTVVITVEYSGVTVDLSRQVILMPNDNPSIVDIFDNGIVSAPVDSQRSVALSIRFLRGSASLNVSINSGTYIQVSLERNRLCEFAINLGLSGGIGQPNQGVNFSYWESSGPVETEIFYDFTRGAYINGSVFVFGPQYGIAYLRAVSGECSDTALFIAAPSTQGYRVDTLTTPDRYNLLSDGNQVWYWGDEQLPEDSAACRKVWIRNAVEWEILSHPIYSCLTSAIVYYDQMRRRFWIVERSAALPDTAWGYTVSGVMDTTVIADAIPVGFLYRGSWIQNNASDDYLNIYQVRPFTGGEPLLFGEYPVELTEEFGGIAGLGYPEAFGFEWWSVNVFDMDGNWLARYPVKSSSGSATVYSVSLLGADSLIIYEVTTSIEHQVRALKPF